MKRRKDAVDSSPLYELYTENKLIY